MPMSGGMQVSTLPSGLELSRGTIDKLELKGTSGINQAVGASLETICTQGGIRNYLSSAETIKIKSTDATDIFAGGTGAARRVRVIGIDGDGAEIQEDVQLNGTSFVSTTNQYLHINDFRVQLTGSGGSFNAGTITAYANDESTALYEIAAGQNQQQSASYAMPANKAGYLTSFVCSATGDAEVSIWLNPNPANPNFPFFQKLTVFVGSGGPTPYQLPNPFPIPKSGIIEFRAKRIGASDVRVGADFQLILEAD